MQKMRRSVENAETVGLFATHLYSPPGTIPAPARQPKALPSPPYTNTSPMSARSGVAALASPGVQRLINPSAPVPAPALHPLLAPRSAPMGMNFSQYLGPSTPFTAPAVPTSAPAAPGRGDPFARIINTPSPNVLVSDEFITTTHSNDPFIRERQGSENTHFISHLAI